MALDGLEHNFYFTLELHTTFVYKSVKLTLRTQAVIARSVRITVRILVPNPNFWFRGT